MRVSENTQFDLIRNTMSKSKGRMEGLQGQLSTLKKLNTPSDDPIGSAKILENRTDKVNNEQFLLNSRLAINLLENTDHALAEMGEVIIRAKEIAIGQSSGASANQETRLAIAEEVSQLFQQAVSAANRRIGDRYLFSGHKTDRAAVNPDGEFVGDKGQMMVEVGRDVFISSNVTGADIFDTKPRTELPSREPSPNRTLASDSPQAGNVNLFKEIQKLRIGLLSGDTGTIQETMDGFDQLLAKINSIRAKVGSRVNGIQNLSESLARQGLTQAKLSSELEDADVAKVVSDLAKEETVFRSALQSSQKLIQPTLLDFIK